MKTTVFSSKASSLTRRVASVATLFALVLSLSFASCSGDDDKGGSTSGDFTSGAKTKMTSFGKTAEGKKVVAYRDEEFQLSLQTKSSVRNYVIYDFEKNTTSGYVFYPNITGMKEAFLIAKAEYETQAKESGAKLDFSTNDLYVGFTRDIEDNSSESYTYIVSGLEASSYTIVK